MTTKSEIREERKEAGLCVDCGDLPPIPGGYTRCKFCLRKKAAKSQSQRDGWRRSGKCSHCGRTLTSPDDDGFKQCLACRKKDRVRQSVNKSALRLNALALMKAG